MCFIVFMILFVLIIDITGTAEKLAYKMTYNLKSVCVLWFVWESVHVDAFFLPNPRLCLRCLGLLSCVFVDV